MHASCADAHSVRLQRPTARPTVCRCRSPTRARSRWARMCSGRLRCRRCCCRRCAADGNKDLTTRMRVISDAAARCHWRFCSAALPHMRARKRRSKRQCFVAVSSSTAPSSACSRQPLRRRRSSVRQPDSLQSASHVCIAASLGTASKSLAASTALHHHSLNNLPKAELSAQPASLSDPLSPPCATCANAPRFKPQNICSAPAPAPAPCMPGTAVKRQPACA